MLVYFIILVHMHSQSSFSLEETVESLQSSLQQQKEQLQQREVANSVLQEQCTQVK